MPDKFHAMAFPTLTEEEIEALRHFASVVEFVDGEYVFKAGQPKRDLFVVEEGRLDVLQAAGESRLIATHEPGGFSGDIDLLTRRPPLVSGIARGKTRLLRVPGERVGDLLNRIPQFGEKLMTAFTTRLTLLVEAGATSLRVVGPSYCKRTSQVREFLYKNFVPFSWSDTETLDGQATLAALDFPRELPIIVCGNGRQIQNPSLSQLAREAGIWQPCPDQEVEFAIIGAGPAGIAAAVYAASEGISTVVLDRIGPGGQVAGSSRIENFIGFPAGLSGTDLATRGVLQMLKFGARMIAPVKVEHLESAPAPGSLHSLHLDCGTTVKSPILLLASGVVWRRLRAEGAESFDDAGIHYVCTSVEAVLYDNADVGVVGAGNSAGQAAIYLAGRCPNRKVHIFVRHKLGPAMSEYLVERILATRNITVHNNCEIAKVMGDRRLEEVEIRRQEAGTLERITCGAIFVFIGADPSASWLPESVARDKLGYLLTGSDALRTGNWPLMDRDPCPLETTVPGILAAGDIRSGSTKRVGFAVGDGSLAVTCLHRLRAMRPASAHGAGTITERLVSQE